MNRKEKASMRDSIDRMAERFGVKEINKIKSDREKIVKEKQIVKK